MDESNMQSFPEEEAELSSPISQDSAPVRDWSNPEVAILLPTYCEAGNIENLIHEIGSLDIDPLIIVIDDSSPDGTAEIAEELKAEYNIDLLVRPNKLGLGTAITDGFRYILSMEKPPSYIITMDADYSHNPQDIPRLMEHAKDGCDLVIGSRYRPGGRIVGWSSLRYLISRTANLAAVTMFNMQVNDCTSGLRCYSLNYIRNVIGDLHSQTYDIQIETVKQARSQKFTIKEIPITFTNRKIGKSKLTLAEIRGFLSYIFKAKLGKW
ncbi:MAG: polyprenol monophosphomannose synthase [Candidatus Bathyarchaeota archaeon]|nr:MAG: polyprenol monophosphomannose synthase [Candidatus Bathyarchaeota archaeon]